jgi:hypothetical protein
MNNKFERIRKEAIIAWFKVLSQHLPGATQKNHENALTASLQGEIWTRNATVKVTEALHDQSQTSQEKLHVKQG